MRLLHLVDTTSGRMTTVKVRRVEYGDGSRDLLIHQIEGIYDSEEAFDLKWDGMADEGGLVNFLSLDLEDARKLVNTVIEEIQR